jgi:hypothetical protein
MAAVRDVSADCVERSKRGDVWKVGTHLRMRLHRVHRGEGIALSLQCVESRGQQSYKGRSAEPWDYED